MERIPRSSTAVVFSEFIHQSDEPMNQSVDIPPCLICVAIIVVVIMACVHFHKISFMVLQPQHPNMAQLQTVHRFLIYE